MPRTWLITGSSRGLGRALARAVVERGDRVVAGARDTRTLAALVDAAHDRVRAVSLDVTDRAAADAAVREAVHAFDRLDVVVNNAGYADLASIEDTTEQAFRDQIETNLWGVINVTRAALPVLRGQGDGRFIQISSVGGRMASPGLGSYQAAKWAVSGLTGVLAAEIAPLGLKATVVEPGAMKTDWGGASMRIARVSPAYERTVGARASWMPDFNERAPTTPESAAAAIIALSELDDPPVRLLLGSDAYENGTKALRDTLAVDERFAALSRSASA
jgi:NAD(P)-dependent dehydrogenase (short-subunit alcohol dehydrogenase family)